MRVLVAGVGYRQLRDHSAGVEVADRLITRAWPDGVVVEDLSYNPIAVVQRLEDDPPDRRFERAIFVGAVERGRAPGTVTVYRWDGVLPSDDEIQRAVTEAVTGVIALDNTLVVARHFKALPDDVVVVEIEPAVHEFGDTFSDVVAGVFESFCARVARLAAEPGAVHEVPRAPLGGPGGSSPAAAGAAAANGGGQPATVGAPATIAGGPLASSASTELTAADDPDLLDEVQRLITALEGHADPEVGTQVSALLRAIDTVHRTALTRLVGAIQGMAGEAFMNRLTADPSIRLLLTSYDLLAVDRRLLAEEALDTVRGHLHAHGIDVELAEVVGGAVYVRLHGAPADAASMEPIRRDLEAALSAGLIGFQELTLGDRPAPGPPLLQIGLRTAHRPVYRRVCAVAEVPLGALKAVEIDGHGVLVANVEGQFHAVADRCGDSPLPLRFGTLEGAELRCSWHGCRYDVRTGQRLDGGAERLVILPIAVEGNEIRIAVDVEPAGRS